VLKQFLADRGLGKSFSGGLSSYALTIVCAVFLKASSKLVWESHLTPPSVPQNGDEMRNGHRPRSSSLLGGPLNPQRDDLGTLLVFFLRFFGEQFDPRVTGVSLSRGFFERKTSAHPSAAAASTLNQVCG